MPCHGLLFRTTRLDARHTCRGVALAAGDHWRVVRQVDRRGVLGRGQGSPLLVDRQRAPRVHHELRWGVQSRINLDVELTFLAAYAVVEGCRPVNGRGHDTAALSGSLLGESAEWLMDGRNGPACRRALTIQPEAVLLGPAEAGAWHVRTNCVQPVVVLGDAAKLGREDRTGVIQKDLCGSTELWMVILHSALMLLLHNGDGLRL